LSKALEFAKLFSSLDDCTKSGCLVKPHVITDVLGVLKKQGSVMDVSKSGLIMHLEKKRIRERIKGNEEIGAHMGYK
jgi:hypothetical protein